MVEKNVTAIHPLKTASRRFIALNAPNRIATLSRFDRVVAEVRAD
jgi:hypothetical protein